MKIVQKTKIKSTTWGVEMFYMQAFMAVHMMAFIFYIDLNCIPGPVILICVSTFISFKSLET